MSVAQAAEAAGRMIAPWGKPKLYSVWVNQPKGGVAPVIVIAIRDAHVKDFAVPDTFEGFNVCRVSWAEATGAVSGLRKAMERELAR